MIKSFPTFFSTIASSSLSRRRMMVQSKSLCRQHVHEYRHLIPSLRSSSALRSSSTLIQETLNRTASSSSSSSASPATFQLSPQQKIDLTDRIDLLRERVTQLNEIHQQAESVIQYLQVLTKKQQNRSKKAESSSTGNRGFTCLSFYHFHSMTKEQSKQIQMQLQEQLPLLDPLIKGTLLISSDEGVNGQFVVPTEKLSSFQQVLQSADRVIFSPQAISLNIGETITIPVTDAMLQKIRLYNIFANETLFSSFDGADNNQINEKVKENSMEREMKIPSKEAIEKVAASLKELLSSRPYNSKVLPSSSSIDEQPFTKPAKSPAKLFLQFSNQMKKLQSKLKKLKKSLHHEIISYYTNYFPFSKLLIKEKKQILTDGFKVNSREEGEEEEEEKESDSTQSEQSIQLDWSDAGDELPPEQWHNEIARNLMKVSYPADTDNVNHPIIIPKDIKQLRPLPPVQDSSTPILLDCRNHFESDIGSFQSAIPVNISTFQETWDRLTILLKETPKDQRILTFCTGGIRCVKVNAFLKQQLGFKNIGRLEKGIIAYERWIEEQNQQSERRNYVQLRTQEEIAENENKKIQSLFIGKNFLFDRRRLTEQNHTQ